MNCKFILTNIKPYTLNFLKMSYTINIQNIYGGYVMREIKYQMETLNTDIACKPLNSAHFGGG